MIESVRQELVLNHIVKRGGVCSIEEIIELLKLSRVTVHRLLNKMETVGLIQKERGGVRLINTGNPGGSLDRYSGMTFELRRKVDEFYKREIAQKALSLISNNDAIYIDTSTTSFYLVEALRQRHDCPLTIVSNSPAVVWEVSEAAKFNTICTGGELDQKLMALVGDIAVKMIDQLSFNKAFISPAAVSPDGIMTRYSTLSEIIQHVLAKKAETILLAETSKHTRVAPLMIAPLNGITRIVTDSAFPAEMRAQYEKRGIEII